MQNRGWLKTVIGNFFSTENLKLDDTLQTSLLNFQEIEKLRKLKLLRRLCLTLLVVVLVSALTFSLLIIMTGQLVMLVALGFYLSGAAGYSISLRLVNAHRLEAASLLTVATLLWVLSGLALIIGINYQISLIFIFVIVLAFALLNWRNGLFATTYCVLFVNLLYTAQEILGIYQPPLVFAGIVGEMANLAAVILGFFGSGGLLFFTVASQLKALEAQHNLIQTSYLELERRQKTIEELSHGAHELTGGLEIATARQALSSQEQIAAIAEVTIGLEELNETAGQIAALTEDVARNATQTVTVAERVGQASEISQATAEEGRIAVLQTLQSVETVRNRIETLGQRLLELTAQTSRVNSVIDLIKGIADETHLLALNASIEAAGSSEMDSAPVLPGSGASHNGQRQPNLRQLRGDRFGVIAQEVKSLADRSRQATEEVRLVIQEMQEAAAAAVLVAEEGKKETAHALARSQVSGSVIDKLTAAVGTNAGEAREILEAVQEVSVRCEEISFATGQQRSANRQILMTMHSITALSEETSQSVEQLSEVAGQVRVQINQLNLVLATAS